MEAKSSRANESLHDSNGSCVWQDKKRMIHSWFFILIGILTLGAAVEAYLNGHPKMMFVSITYALADFVLATIGE